jgi:hypothetical protein
VTTTLRDFLYLDVDRVRSVLAQLEGGVVEQSVERLTKSKNARAGGSLFGLLDLRGGFFRERATEQTKSLQDALFLLFEDAASSSGLFESGVDFHDEAAWRDGAVHADLMPGQLIRVTAPTRILDAKHFRERIERFAKWVPLIAAFSISDELNAIKTPKERERRIAAQADRELGGSALVETIHRLGEFVDLFLASQISIRQFPCDVAKTDLAFVGTLLGRAGYLQEEREALFSKYGSGASEWTVVSQVAAVPEDREAPTEIEMRDFVSGSERINRERLEDMAIQLMQLLETHGVAEGPAYPAVTVTTSSRNRVDETTKTGNDELGT